MELGDVHVYYLYPDATPEDLRERAEQVWSHYRDRQSEPGAVVRDSYGGGTLWIHTDPVGGMIEPFTASGPPGIERGPDYPRLELQVDADQQIRFPVERDGRDRLEGLVGSLVSTAAEIYRVLDPAPAVAYSHTWTDRESIRAGRFGQPVSEAALAENRVEYLPWFAILPPAVVETYGRERLLSAPVWRTERLDDGSVLVAAYYDLLASKLRQWDTADLNHHLGLPDPYEDCRKSG